MKAKDFFDKRVKDDTPEEGAGLKAPEDDNGEESQEETQEEETQETTEDVGESPGESQEEHQEESEAKPESEEEKEDPIERYNKFAKDMGYEDADAFFNSKAMEKLKGYDELKDSFEKTKQENEELYSTYEQSQNPFAKAEVYKINKLISENEGMPLDVASKIAKGGFDEMNNYDLLVLNAKREDPDMSERLIKKSLERKYDIDDWDELDDDAKDFMEMDARKAKRTLSKMSDIEVPERIIPDNIQEKIKNKQEEASRSIEEIEQEWSPVMEKFDDAFKEIPVPYEHKGKNEVIANYVLSDKDKTSLRKKTDSIIKNNKIKPTKENIASVNEMVLKELYFDRLPKLIGIAVDKAVNDYKEQAQKSKYNPSTPSGKKADKASGKKSLDSLPGILRDKYKR